MPVSQIFSANEVCMLDTTHTPPVPRIPHHSRSVYNAGQTGTIYAQPDLPQ